MSGAAETRYRVAPILTATVTTVLVLWLVWAIADLLLLLFIAVLVSLYLGSFTDFLVERLRAPRGLAFAAAIVITLAALGTLGGLLVPPVVTQTQQLVGVLPEYVRRWQEALAAFALKYPAFGEVASPRGEVVDAVVKQLEGAVGGLFPTVVNVGHEVINFVAILVMGIYLSLYPGLYREWLIALFPPVHRDVVRDTLRDIGTTLRAWIVAQGLAMSILAALTAAGLYMLRVPYWLTFGIFVGVVVIVPVFGTLIGTLLPALFVLGGNGVAGIGPGGHFLLVVLLGVVIHLIEGNFVLPLITSRRVELPPVLSMMAVLVVGRLFGVGGVVVAVPLMAVVMVLVRRILIHRVYEGQSFRRVARDGVLILRVPAPDAGVLTPREPIDVLHHASAGAGTV